MRAKLSRHRHQPPMTSEHAHQPVPPIFRLWCAGVGDSSDEKTINFCIQEACVRRTV